MCNSCDACGYKNSEVKGAGGISPQGRRIKLHVQEQDDLRCAPAGIRPLPCLPLQLDRLGFKASEGCTMHCWQHAGNGTVPHPRCCPGTADLHGGGGRQRHQIL